MKNRLRPAGLLSVVLVVAVVLPVLAEDGEEARRRRISPVVEVFRNCRDSVVNISTTRKVRLRSRGFFGMDDIFDFGRRRLRNREIHSVGSGAIVHESGYIVTNAHVVSQASDVKVIFADESEYPADVVAVDSTHDLAVLKIKASEKLPYQKLGSSDDIMIGETVVAIGNPLGLQHTVTAGIVSALERELDFGNETVYSGLIQTDASINPGNSGGPLLNVNGELIGINTAIRGDAQNIGFAIPVDRLWQLLPRMLDIERRQRVRFGLQVSGPNTEVLSVRPDSPAEKAGLKVGDRIQRFNGEALRNGIDYYVHLLQIQPGDEVKLSVGRGDETFEKSLELVAVPLPDGKQLAKDLLGVNVVELSPQDRRAVQRLYDIPVGLIVADLEGVGPAGREGVREDDIVLRVEGVPVLTLKDLGLALEQVEAGERIVVEIFRLRADPAFICPVTIKTRRPGI